MKIIKAFFLILVSVAFVVFAIVNREKVAIDFFPLPYTVELPKFMMAIACFALGTMFGWVAMSLRTSKQYFQLKSEHKRVQALENELTVVKNEHRDQPLALAADK